MCLLLLLAYLRNLQIFIGQSVTFMTGHLFTFLVVLSLICSATMKILICENQTIWRLEIRLRKILATLLKANCRGHFVKNKRYQETGKEYFTIVQMIVKEEVTNILLLEQHLMPDYAHPAYPPPHKHTHTHRHTHTHTLTKKDTDYLMTSVHPTSSPHNLFSNSHHDEYTSFLITQLPKNKRNFIP